MRIESLMAEEYLGKSVLDRLRDEYNSRRQSEAQYLADYVHSAIMEIIYRPLPGSPIKAVLWFYCRQIIERLADFPEYYDMWSKEVGDTFHILGFKNDKKGAYFF